MRWGRFVIIGVLVIVSLIAAVYVYLNTYDYNKLKPLVAQMIEDATGRELNLGGEIDLAIGFSPALVMTDVTFANASWGSQPQMIKVEKLEAQVRLLPLLFRDLQLKRIGLAGVDVLLEADPNGKGNWDFIAGDGSARKAGAFKPKDIEIDNIRIEKFQLIFREGKTGSTKRFTLATLDVAQKEAEDELTLDLKADYNGQPVTLSGNTGRMRYLFAHQRFPLELSGTFSNAKVDIAGAIDDILDLRGIDLKVHASGTNLAALGFDKNIQLPKTDVFDVAGHLRGSKESLALNDFSGNLSSSDVHLAFSGIVGDLIAINGINLKLKGSGKDLTEIGSIIGEKLPATDEFKVQGRLTGSANLLSLSEAQGSARRGALSLALDGGIKDLLNFSGVDLVVNGSGKNLTAVGAIIDKKLPATDEFAIKGRLTGSAKALSLKEAQGSAKQGSLSVALSGEVKDLIDFSGLDLKLKGAGKDLSEIEPLIGEQLPKTGAFTLEGRLKGSAKTLSLQEILGNTRRGGLKLNLQGRIKNLLALSGMDLKVNGSGKDLSEVGPIIGKKLPASGEFAVKGRLTGSTKALALQNSQGRIRRGDLRLSLDGSIKNLIALTGIDIKFKSSGMDLAEVGPIIGEKLPSTDNFAIQGRLMGSTEALSLREASGRAGRNGMSIAFDGGITDVLALRSINIRLKASGKELAAIGPLVGTNLPKLGSFDVRGHLIGSTEFLMLKDFSAIVDKSDFNGLAKVEFIKRPKITLSLVSSVIDFTALMKSLEKNLQKTASKDKQKRRLFSDDPLPIDALEKVDADIELKAKNIHAKDAHLEFGHLTLTLEDSNLSIDKLEATYKETKISGNLHIDSGSPPKVATNFLIQNFNLGDFLKEIGKSDQVRAVIDIAAHGKSSGDSVNSLITHLNGAFGAVMGPGYLTKYLDLLSRDLSAKVIPFWGRHKKADEINCAVVQFDIKNGDAISNAFVFDTQVGILSAEGDINLGTERVNFLLNPQPKDFSLVNLSTKLRVSGTLLNPKVRPDMVSLATKGAKALSTLALGPIGLLAPFVHLGAHNKHPCEVKSLGELGLSVPVEE